MTKTFGRYCCQNFKMPRLTRSDLRALEKIVLLKLKPKHYKIAFDGIEYPAVENIPTQSSKKYSLVIHTQNPGMRLKLSHGWAELYSEEIGREEPEMQQIIELISKRERKSLWHTLKFAPWLGPIAGFGIFGITTQLVFLEILPISAYFVALGLLLLFAGWWALGYRISLYQFSCIDLRS
jgi:hypothetical protein